MNRLLFAFALLALPLTAQVAFRADPTSVFTTIGTTPPGAQAPLYVVGGAGISVCTTPACSSQATTYTSSTAGSACPTFAQVTLPGSTQCVATAGALGQFGFWALPGTYYYTVTTSAGTVGPYPVTVGGSGGGTSAWASLTPGTNTQGAFFFGSGASLSTTGSGQINANVINGVLPSTLSTGVAKWTNGTGVPGNALAADVIGLFTGCTGTKVLSADGTCQTVAGTGTVTSVGITFTPTWLTVTGSPITSSGTITFAATTGQTSHQVIGTCGAATSFAPCALVASDIPTLNQNTTGNAATATALDHTPSQCTAGNAALGIAASGNANCTALITAGAALGSTQIVTGAGGSAIQTPSSAATVDSSGNGTLNSLTTGNGSAQGLITILHGTTPASPAANNVRIFSNSSNSDHLSVVNSAGTVVDLQAATVTAAVLAPTALGSLTEPNTQAISSTIGTIYFYRWTVPNVITLRKLAANFDANGFFGAGAVYSADGNTLLASQTSGTALSGGAWLGLPFSADYTTTGPLQVLLVWSTTVNTTGKTFAGVTSTQLSAPFTVMSYGTAANVVSWSGGTATWPATLGALSELGFIPALALSGAL